MGRPSDRAELLKRAIEVDPDYAPAHWQLGQVRLDDRWLSVDEAAQERARAGKIDEYRKRRERTHLKADEQLKLASWCEHAGLKEQERVHLVAALVLQPKSRDLVKKLGLTRFQGMLVSPQQRETLEEQARDAEDCFKKWTPRLSKMKEAIAEGSPAKVESLLNDVRRIRDPAAIPALEAGFANGTADEQAAVIYCLGAMPEQAATDSLVRFAILSEVDEAREAAAKALKPRNLFSFVPTLMGALESPIDTKYRTLYSADQFGHQLTMYQEGPLSGRSLVSTGASSTQTSLNISPRRGTYNITSRTVPDPTANSDAALADLAKTHNTMVDRSNERVAEALRTTTGQDLSDDPKLWWNWWLDYNEIYQPSVKPVTQQVRTYVPPPSTFRVSYSSCFVAGTPVWTMTGPMPVEQVKVGECVLAQDPATGELAYKPVMATTVRPASPVIAVRAGGDTIRATRGHPFWVSGRGWQMTKELKAGDSLHTPDGAVAIESAEPDGQAECYNMVVADFGTYFVGQKQVLVHDNNIRDVTPAIVPGLVLP
ncbi:MAG: hypothetical protein HYX69_08600 [Planctomycetia bacterium]|nr:hypothetical protein [Planctomycetia bacterium]